MRILGTIIRTLIVDVLSRRCFFREVLLRAEDFRPKAA